MTTNNTTIEVSQETINYFDESFHKEGLNYVKFGLIREMQSAEKDYQFYDNQANMFARMAQAQRDKIEGLKFELEAVKSAMKQKATGVI